ncbi:MAG: hypothetical protein KGP28_11130 [Bdellovibrionales bacterium]|nr:hypothetical protein [Bdellovibrionales bacterium]
MSRKLFRRFTPLFIFFSLISIAYGAPARPKKKPINPKAAVEKLFSDRAKKVNRKNREIKEASGLTPEEERELRSKKHPLTLTPEQERQEEIDAANTPEDQEPDEDEMDDEKPGAMAGKPGTGPAPGSKSKAGESYPSSVPSSGRSTAVPGQADSNLIVFPGKKK